MFRPLAPASNSGNASNLSGLPDDLAPILSDLTQPVRAQSCATCRARYTYLYIIVIYLYLSRCSFQMR